MFLLNSKVYRLPTRPNVAKKHEIVSTPVGTDNNRMTAPRSYLFQLATFGAHEGQRVVLVDVGNDRSHAVPVLREDRNATYHLGHAQGCIHIQATEVIVNS